MHGSFTALGLSFVYHRLDWTVAQAILGVFLRGLAVCIALPSGSYILRSDKRGRV